MKRENCRGAPLVVARLVHNQHCGRGQAIAPTIVKK